MNHVSRITGATFFEIAVSIRSDEGLQRQLSNLFTVVNLQLSW